MHKLARWNYFISLAFSVFFVVIAWAISNYYQAPLVSAADSTNNIRGWGYSSNSGWISLNYLNDGACSKCTGGTNDGLSCRKSNNSSDCPGGACNDIALCPAYGLSLVPTNNHQGEITGYAWSSSLGYICFGNTCTGTPPTPPGGEKKAAYVCKGKICHSNGVNSATPPTQDISSEKDGLACTTDENCGCTVLEGDTCSYVIAGSCYDDGNTPCDQAEPADVTGWAKILNQGQDDKGWISLSGNVNSDPPSTYGLQILFNQCFAADSISPITCTPELGKSTMLSGWAWHQAGGINTVSSKTAYGVGWLCFSKPECISESEILFPYVYGQGGDIFSSGSIKTMFPPPTGQHNADYLIHVGGSNIGANFKTACTNSSCKETKLVLSLPSATATEGPSDEDIYNFKLGRFDFKGLATKVDGTLKNIYNFEVEENFPQITADGSVSLAGKVYVVTPVTGSYTVDQVLTIKNGIVDNGVDVSGAGTIIIRGDLIVNSDIKYETGSVSRKRLASVVWFVLGDVKVAANVKEMAGTYIVLGKRAKTLCKNVNDSWGAVCSATSPCSGGGACIELGKVCNRTDGIICTNDGVIGDGICNGVKDSCKPKYLALNDKGDLYDGFGKFDSCNPATNCGDNQLLVNGSVFARQFKLNRTYVDVVYKESAENFKAGGRLQLNPPPGMEDLSNGLPTFSRR
jgi:hypothetical protein